jgi:membrane protein
MENCRVSQEHSQPAPVGIFQQLGRQMIAVGALLRKAWVEYQRDHARFFAAAMIYYALISLVPLLLLLLSVLGVALRFSPALIEVQQQVLKGIEASFGAELRGVVEQLLTALQQDSLLGTLLGVIGLLLTGSILFRQLRLSFRAIWKYAPPLASGSLREVVRVSLVEQVMAYAVVLLVGVLLLAALVLYALAAWLNGLIAELPLLGRLGGWALTTLSPLALAVLIFALLFKVLPPAPQALSDVVLPALVCAVAWWFAGQLLALYVAFFGSGFSAYGALGSLLAIMLWMNIVSQVLFFGAELCKLGGSQAVTSE